MAQCRATARSTGQRCERRAIRGGTVCRVHGGAAIQVKRAAAQRVALVGMQDLLGPDVAASDPTQVLTDALNASAALLAAAKAAACSEEADVDTLNALGEAALLAAKLAKTCLDAGLEARIAHQAERNGRAVAGLVTKAINALELPPAASAGVWRIIRAELQAGSLDVGRYAGMSIAELDVEIAAVVDELDALDARDAVEGFPSRLAGCLDVAFGALDLSDADRETAITATERYLTEQAAEREERERLRRERAQVPSPPWWVQPASRNGGHR